MFKKTSANPTFVNIIIKEDLLNTEDLFGLQQYLNQVGTYINGLLRVDITVIDLKKLKNKLCFEFNMNLKYFTIKQQSHEVIY